MREKELRRKWDKMLKCEDARAYKMIHDLIPEFFKLAKRKGWYKDEQNPFQKVKEKGKKHIK